MADEKKPRVPSPPLAKAPKPTLKGDIAREHGNPNIGRKMDEHAERTGGDPDRKEGGREKWKPTNKKKGLGNAE